MLWTPFLCFILSPCFPGNSSFVFFALHFYFDFHLSSFFPLFPRNFLFPSRYFTFSSSLSFIYQHSHFPFSCFSVSFPSPFLADFFSFSFSLVATLHNFFSLPGDARQRLLLPFYFSAIPRCLLFLAFSFVRLIFQHILFSFCHWHCFSSSFISLSSFHFPFFHFVFPYDPFFSFIHRSLPSLHLPALSAPFLFRSFSFHSLSFFSFSFPFPSFHFTFFLLIHLLSFPLLSFQSIS